MIRFVAETASTNADLLGGGAAFDEGSWLVAHRQTAGRGRAGRGWSDGAGNFMGSTLVALRPSDPPPQTLAIVAGVATHEAVASLPDAPPGLVLKWPNDLLVGSAKLGGILLERRGDRVVVGVGVNLARAPELPERPTVALADVAVTPPLDEFAAALARRFALALERWHEGEWPALRAEWLGRAHPVGSALEVREREQHVLRGTFAGLGETGEALLRLAEGGTRAIHAGDIEWLG